MRGDGSCEGYCLLKALVLNAQLNGEYAEQTMQRKPAVDSNFLEEICDGCNECCLRKEISSRIYNERFLVQMRCVDDYKWVLGEEFEREVDSEEALKLWIKRGYAQAFAEIWEGNQSANIRHWDLFVKLGERVAVNH